MRLDNLCVDPMYSLIFRPVLTPQVWPNSGDSYSVESWSGLWPWAMGDPVYEVQREARYPTQGVEGYVGDA